MPHSPHVRVHARPIIGAFLHQSIILHHQRLQLPLLVLRDRYYHLVFVLHHIHIHILTTPLHSRRLRAIISPRDITFFIPPTLTLRSGIISGISGINGISGRNSSSSRATTSSQRSLPDIPPSDSAVDRDADQGGAALADES